jgi:alpha-galactosidase
MSVHELVVQALLEHDKQKAKYALMIDPLTAAVCSLEEIDRLFEEMWTAEMPYLQVFD